VLALVDFALGLMLARQAWAFTHQAQNLLNVATGLGPSAHR
jgi:hypothetical protein